MIKTVLNCKIFRYQQQWRHYIIKTHETSKEILSSILIALNNCCEKEEHLKINYQRIQHKKLQKESQGKSEESRRNKSTNWENGKQRNYRVDFLKKPFLKTYLWQTDKEKEKSKGTNLKWQIELRF